MNLLGDFILAFDATKKSLRVSATNKGKSHVFTLRVPVVKKRVTRGDLVFKVEPAGPGALRLLVYEKEPPVTYGKFGGFGNCEWEF